LIVISAIETFQDASAESEAEIEGRLRAGDELAGVAIDTYKRRTIDGARGWGAAYPTRSGGHSEAWVFYKGSRRVNMSCWWNQETVKDRILAGCAQVLDTLTIA
jgi:hypothetical protein